MALTSEDIVAITNALSPARLSTYKAPATSSTNGLYPLELYRWNSEISGAFLTPLEIFSVVLRNGISAAIEAKYGESWPWVTGFERTLPSPTAGYNPRSDLLQVRKKFTSTGKVIPELKLVFWSQMLTSRHDQRLWKPFMRQVFPNIPSNLTVSQARSSMYADIEKLRNFRNRIAHHEPIFKAPLAQNLASIIKLVSMRCMSTMTWLKEIETVTPLIQIQPLHDSHTLLSAEHG